MRHQALIHRTRKTVVVFGGDSVLVRVHMCMCVQPSMESCPAPISPNGHRVPGASLERPPEVRQGRARVGVGQITEA